MFQAQTQFFRPEQIADLPMQPGVYRMRDSTGCIIYVGKAKQLRKRVASYFSKEHSDEKTRALVSRVDHLDVVVTTNERDALLLEISFIKEYAPRYNVFFKDNKFYPYLHISVSEQFPRVWISRQKPGKHVLSFGPYPHASQVHALKDVIERLFLLRTCRALPKRACMQYHIHRCTAPCEQKVSEEAYRAQVQDCLQFLQQDLAQTLDVLEKAMKEAAANLAYEKAAVLKARIHALKDFEASGSIYLSEDKDMDVLGYASFHGKAVLVFMELRKGRVTAKYSFSAALMEGDGLEDALLRFLTERYLHAETALTLLMEPVGLVQGLLVQALAGSVVEAGAHPALVECRSAENEEERRLLRTAMSNAAMDLSQILTRIDSEDALHTLMNALQLPDLPMRMECFDIAHTQGAFTTAALVSFWAGKPDKSRYRLFAIRSVANNDFDAMYEAVTRRYRHAESLPHLLLIDGGKGQLHAALRALEHLGVELSVCSLAKEEEEIFLPGRSEALRLPPSSKALQLLQHLRDEAHRFSNKKHAQRRDKAMLSSLFEGIAGIGPKRRQRLIEQFVGRDPALILDAELLSIGVSEDALDPVKDILAYCWTFTTSTADKEA